MSNDVATSTEAILRSVAQSLRGLDEAELQHETTLLHVAIQELNRQTQERQFAIQLHQLEAQRRSEAEQRLRPAIKWRGDKTVQTALGEMWRAVAQLDPQVLQNEIGVIQAELQDVSRQVQERQHVLGLKQMLNQGQLQPGLMQVQNFQAFPPGVGIQVGFPVGSMEGAGASSRPVEASEKRRAILELFTEQPGRAWSPVDVRRALVQRGMPRPDDGTPVRNLLWKMHKDGLIDRPASGKYGLAMAIATSSEADGPEQQDAQG